MGYLLQLLANLNSRRHIQAVFFIATAGIIAWLIFPSSNASDNEPVSSLKSPQERGVDASDSRLKAVAEPAQLVSEPFVNPQPSFDFEMKKIKAEGFQNRAKLLVEDLNQLESDYKKWTQLVCDLATNDRGRRLASNQNDLPAIKVVLETKVISDSELLTMKDEVKLIERNSALNGLIPPGSDLLAAVEDATSKISTAQKAADRAIRSILQFENENTNLPISNITLSEAIKKFENEQLAESNRELAAAKAESKRVLAKQAVDDEVKLREAKYEANKHKLKNGLEAIKAGSNADSIAAQAAREKAILEAEFHRDLPQIRQHLGQLFADGYTQPTSRGFVQSETAGPMSLGGIRDFGALDNPEGMSGGYARMLHLFSNSSGNDRSQSYGYLGFIGGHPKANEVEGIRPAYQFLKKYQTLLVEKKLLAK